MDFRKDIYLNEKNKAKNKIINYEKLPTIIGCEINKKVFEQANVNISLAGLENYIELINDDFLALQLSCSPGIIICNPPYGKKLGDENELIHLSEEMYHHPEININHTQVTVTLFTRDLNDVTDRDIQMSKKIDEIIEDINVIKFRG